MPGPHRSYTPCAGRGVRERESESEGNMTERDLYFISGSPPCWSVMLALAVKGVAYTPQRLSNSAGEQKSDAFKRISPRGHVPVLVDGGTVLRETLAVLAYLDAAYAEPRLFGETPAETAQIWQVISECDSHLRKPVGDLARPLFRGKAAENADQITKDAATVRDELALLEHRLTATDWLCGAAVSAADVMVFPIVMQMARATAKPEAAPLDLRLSPLGDHFPHLAAWQTRVEALPGYDDAYPPHWK